VGLVPGVLGSIEFEWGEEAPLTLGARFGLGSAIFDVDDEECTADPCLRWLPSFIGGFTGRFRLRSGFALEVVAGPTSHLAVGWTLGRKGASESR
jgi:hypothetical protein